MRSEIFNKIRQNKIQHYAELNKSNNEAPSTNSSNVSEKGVKKPVQENKTSGKVKYDKPDVVLRNVQNSFESVLQHLKADVEIIKRIELKPVILNIFPKVKLIMTGMVKIAVWIWFVIKSAGLAFIHSRVMTYIRKRIENDQKKLKQINDKVNEHLNLQSEKLARGIYKASSGLFEEKEENITESTHFYAGFTECNSDENSIEWELEINSQAKVTFNERLAALSEKTAYQIRSFPNKINAFLASDKLPDLDGMTLSGMK